MPRHKHSFADSQPVRKCVSRNSTGVLPSIFDNLFSGVQRTDIKPQSKHYMSVVLRRIAKYQRESLRLFFGIQKLRGMVPSLKNRGYGSVMLAFQVSSPAISWITR